MLSPDDHHGLTNIRLRLIGDFPRHPVGEIHQIPQRLEFD